MNPSKIMKQVNVPWIGSGTNVLFTTLPFFSLINFLSIIIVLYATTSSYVKEFAPWLTFGIFIIILIPIVLLVMFLVHKFVLPSMWTYREKQMFSYSSDIANTLKSIDARLKRLEEKELSQQEIKEEE